VHSQRRNFSFFGLLVIDSAPSGGTIMRRVCWLIPLLTACAAAADEPPCIERPKAFETLVNPMCSHCRTTIYQPTQPGDDKKGDDKKGDDKKGDDKKGDDKKGDDKKGDDKKGDDKKGDDKKPSDAVKEIAGTAEFLLTVPKKFAALKGVDVARNTVTLRADGESEDKTWPLIPDAEIKVRGWWGRLSQLAKTPRVWVFFHVDRTKKPVAVFMLADELSEQDIYGPGSTVKSVTKDKVVVTTMQGKDRDIPVALTKVDLKNGKNEIELLNPKDRVFVAESFDKERWQLIDAAGFEVMRKAQQAWLRTRWTEQGLPGTVGLLHVYNGEADVILDHEAMRWGRSLNLGDKVELAADPPIKAVVKSVHPEREKTRVRLVAKTFDLAELKTGQRVHFKMNAPPPSVEDDAVPPDADRPRSKAERIDWFLASIYCTCTAGSGDKCTGNFYTLASCNFNGCGMPNTMRKLLAKKIDEGLTDRQIFVQLIKDKGPLLQRPHLIPELPESVKKK
jgi:hypothetical protein